MARRILEAQADDRADVSEHVHQRTRVAPLGIVLLAHELYE
jgi:hypothetical protein